jgi:hypothetical protein
MVDATIEFSRAARVADVALFYYSGHALQFNGINYLAPVDASLTDESDLRRMTRLDEIVTALQEAKNLRILVLDSCRDNPLAEQLRRSLGASRAIPLKRELAKIDTPEGMIVAYATQAGQTADDGEGRNSPYTTAFLKHIEEQDEIGTIFREVSEDVYETTKHTQLAELSLSMIGRFYLRGKVEITTKVDSTASEFEAAERLNTVTGWDAFLKEHPDGFYATLAKERRAQAAGKLAIPPKANDHPHEPAASDGQGAPLQVAALVPPVQAPVSCGSNAVVASLSSRAPAPLSASEECPLKPKDVFKECDKCPEMVVVPPGSFTMGSPSSENGRGNDEGPQHVVTIPRRFAVGRFTVTFDEWDACVADRGCNGYTPPDQGWSRGRRPVINVTHNDVENYVAWLSRKTGKPYRLMHESEWEYVAS